jgi:hypothetical protein
VGTVVEGRTEGIVDGPDGLVVGRNDGRVDGLKVGPVGTRVGILDGCVVGVQEGSEGIVVGIRDIVGLADGLGVPVGRYEGANVGLKLGSPGPGEGRALGSKVGRWAIFHISSVILMLAVG